MIDFADKNLVIICCSSSHLTPSSSLIFDTSPVPGTIMSPSRRIGWLFSPVILKDELVLYRCLKSILFNRFCSESFPVLSWIWGRDRVCLIFKTRRCSNVRLFINLAVWVSGRYLVAMLLRSLLSGVYAGTMIWRFITGRYKGGSLGILALITGLWVFLQK